MDIVIPYIASRNNEIRYALRSVDLYFKSVGRIWIIGDLPMHGTGPNLKPIFKAVNQIITENTGNSREHRIFNKISTACNISEVSNEFLMMNDDHFFLKPIDIVPFWFDSSLEETAAYRRYQDGYTKSLKNTQRYLSSNGLPTYHFDIHAPIVYNKKRFLELNESVDWATPFGFTIKSLYCNSKQGVRGEYLPDYKINQGDDIEQMKRGITGRPVFSTGDKAFPRVKRLLDELYPNPSRWEI